MPVERGLRVESATAESVLFALGLGVAATGFILVVFLANALLSPRRPTEAKGEPYECGMPPAGKPWKRVNVRYVAFALLFVVFDVEIIFLFVWATIWTDLGWYGIAAILIFTFFVVETLMYVWKRGALDWNVKRRSRYINVEKEAA